MRELIALIVQTVAGIVLPAYIVKRDERHLAPERFARGWPFATFWCSVVTFGVFCLPIHFWRTRRSVAGFVIGLAWAIGATVALAGLGLLLGS